MKYDSVREAVQAWVREFNAIPQTVIEKLSTYDFDVMEITPPAKYDRVYIYTGGHGGERGEISGICTDGYEITLDNGDSLILPEDAFDVERKCGLPIWGTMWTFDDACDAHWLEEHLQEMADCGFRIYEQEDFGYVFGIDGAGYDFYEEHWIPLYKARGLHWHIDTPLAS